jgi:hemophore-related protein
MIKLSLSRLTVAVGALAVSLSAGAGVASAEPDLGPAINSTCTYSQAVAAMHAQNPEAAAAFDASPPDQANLRQFLATPPSGRVALAQMFLNLPGAEQAIPILQQAFSVCKNY